MKFRHMVKGALKVKKIISATVAMILLILLCSCGGNENLKFGDTTVEIPREPSKDLEFTLLSDGKSYAVTGIGECQDDYIVIPSEHEGYPVTRIGKMAFSSEDIIGATIPDSVNCIEERAFAGLVYFKSVIIPDSVTEIGNSVFANCYALEDVRMSASVKQISEGLFFECNSLKDIDIPEGVVSIGKSAFEGCTQLYSPTLPNSLVEIGESAFAW